MDVIDAVATRVAVNRAKSRLTSRFAGAVTPVSGTVIGEGLALVNGQLVNAAVSEAQIGETLSLQNAGRAAAAVYVPTAGAGGVASASSGGGGVVSVPAGGLIAHDLGGDFHIGQLRSDQAAWALMVDGSRMLMGDMDVHAGVLIDGVDLDVHAADPAAHHDPVTVGVGLALSVQQVSLASSVAGAGLGFDAGVLNVGAGYGIQVNGDDVQLAPSVAGAGLAYDAGVLAVNVAGLGMGVANDAVTLTSSSNPGASAAVLASDSAGWLNLQGLNAAIGLRSPYVSTFSGDLSLMPAQDLVLSPASDLVHFPSDIVFRSDGYQSQVAGLQITAAGSGDFRYLYADEMHAKSFIADLEQALAGGQIVSKSVAVVAESFTLPVAGGAVAVRFKDLPSAPNMAVFQSGDWVAFRSFSRAGGSLTVGWAWGQVTSYADGTGGNEGTQTWIWTRNAGTPGAATGTIAADAIALDFGVSGNGYYEVNAIDGQYAQNSPYWRIVTWAGHPATQTVRVQGGNLRGLFGQANEYGFYAGDGTTTSSKYLRLSTAANEFRNLEAEWYSGSERFLRLSADSGISLYHPDYDTSDYYSLRSVGFRTMAGSEFARVKGNYYTSGADNYYTLAMHAMEGNYGNSPNHYKVWIQAATEKTGGKQAIVLLRAKDDATSEASTDKAEIKLTYSGSTRTIEMVGSALTFNGYNVALRDTAQTITGQWTLTNHDLTLPAHYYTAMYSTYDNYIHFYPLGGNGSNYSRVNMRVWNGAGSYRTLQFAGNGAFTWEGATVWTSANDGPGSTLDADTIDTVDSSRIIYGDNGTGSSVRTDINWNAKSGFYSKTAGGGAGGAPSDNYYHVIEATYIWDSYYMMQLAQGFWSTDLWHRIAYNNGSAKTFSPWKLIADQDNLSSGAFSNVRFSGHTMAGSTGLSEAGAVSAENWFRSVGNTGWYNATHTGGIYMDESTTVKIYNGKNFYCPATISAEYLLVGNHSGALGSWANVSLGTGWANYGGGYVAARYRRFGDLIQVHGMVYCTNASYTGILNLPYQIAARYIYQPASSVQHARVDAVPGSGYTSIQVVGTPVLNQWIMLDMLIPIY